MNYNVIKEMSKWQWIWFVEASCRLLWIRIRLTIGSIEWLNIKLNADQQHDQRISKEKINMAVDMYEAVRLAARCQYGQPACLPKSIVLYDMLQARASAAQLHIGINKEQKVLYGHAWVTLFGSIVTEADNTPNQFVELAQNNDSKKDYSKNKVARPRTEK